MRKKILIIGLMIGLILISGCNKKVESSNLDEFYDDISKLYEKGNVTFSIIYTELPQCRLDQGSGFFEVNQDGKPRYWIEFITQK